MTLNFNFNVNSASANITIERENASGDVPHAVFMRVDGWTGFDTPGPTGSNVRDERLHKIYYFWDFYHSGTDNSYTYNAPENIYDGNAKHTNGHRNSRYAYGCQVSHIYRQAGTYTARCTAIEASSGKTAIIDQVIVAGASPITGADVIFVSASGDFTDAPAGATQRTNSDLDDVWLADVLGQDTTPKKIILNRGETFSFSGINPGFTGTPTPTTYLIGGDGPGDKPIINWDGDIAWNDKETSQTTPTKDLIIQNVAIFGTFDSTIDTDPTNDEGVFSYSDYPPQVFLLDACVIHDVANIASPSIPTPGAGIFFNDTVMDGFSYAFISGGGGGYFASMGCLVKSKDNALVDATDQQGWGYRVGDETTYIFANDFGIFQDWFGASPRNIQAAIRLAANSDEGTRFSVVGNFIEGGFHVANSQHSDSPAVGRAVNAIWDKNYMTGISSTVALLNVTTGGMTIRNNILNIPPISGARSQPNGTFISFDSTDNQALNTSQAIEVYSNAFVNLEDGTAMSEFTNVNSEFTAITFENNINHQPNASSPVTTSAPLKDDANDYFVSRWLGYRDSGSPTLDTTKATVKTAGNFDLYSPEAGSSALGAAGSGLVAYDDMFGVIRPATKDIGPVQVSA